MNELIIKIHNVSSGEIIEREMTEKEIIELSKIAEKDAKLKAEAQAQAAARQAILDRLGLTEDEAKLLLG